MLLSLWYLVLFFLCCSMIMFNVIFYNFTGNYFVWTLQQLGVVLLQCCLILTLNVSIGWDIMGCAVAYIIHYHSSPCFAEFLFTLWWGLWVPSLDPITEQDYLKFHIPWHSFFFINNSNCETDMKKCLMTSCCFQNLKLLQVIKLSFICIRHAVQVVLLEFWL